jgi:alanine racemase
MSRVAQPTAPVRGLRPAQARIDLGRLADNYRAIADYAALPVMPVVKADAYGHGAVQVGKRLVAEGAPLLAVAYLEEALPLRAAGIKVPIVVLAGFWPGQEDLVLKHQLTPVVSTPGTLQRAVELAKRKPGQLKVHLKVDTGMARLGFGKDEYLAAGETLVACPGLEVEGVMTHLASADEDRSFTEKQLDKFDEALVNLAAKGLRPRYVHAANSAGLAFKRRTHTLVRPGLLVYGVPPKPLSPPVKVKPVMQVVAPIGLVKTVPPATPVSYGCRWVAPRTSRIATVALGYADGVPRTDRMRTDGYLVVRGKRAKVVGTVCMDLVLLDVTDHADVGEGDGAVLLGDDPTAWGVAEWAGTNAWEALTSVGPRLPRVYMDGGLVVATESRFLPHLGRE